MASNSDTPVGAELTESEWNDDLDDEGREEILGSRLEAREETTGGETPEFEDLPDKEQKQTQKQVEQSPNRTAEALDEALGQTWWANAFEEDDDSVTIPFEMHTLTENQQDELFDIIEPLMELEGVESDDLDEARDELGDNADEVISQISGLNQRLGGLLDEATVEDDYDEAYWQRGEFPAGMQMALLFELVDKYADKLQNAQSFR